VVSAIRARGGRAVAVRADVAAPGDVADMFARARQEMGPLGGAGQQRRDNRRAGVQLIYPPIQAAWDRRDDGKPETPEGSGI
jgi:NAD(P)-dependent dehydrogenase (short-subunit alcohol dehydrogenase family)